MNSARRMAAVVGLLATSWGCGGATTVAATVVHPAQVPVRSYPRIWIAGGHLDHEIELLDALADHLRGGRAEVRRVELDHLEPMRVQGRIPPATVVVILDLRFVEATRPEWTTRPETVCGPLGCYTANRSYAYELPTLRARLTVTVYDGPTARVEQRVTIDAHDEGDDYLDMRHEVVRQLKTKLLRMVDQRRESVEVELLEVDVPEVERALAVIEEGDWTRGRRMLEEAWHGGAVRSLEPEDRARVLYDIGQARRFDPSTLDDPEAHFDAAERALRAAVRLDPRDEYDRALAALRRHRREVVVARAQQEAAEHNYRLAEPAAPPVPDPPPDYQPY